MSKKYTSVYRTENYEQFRRLIGNREVTDQRVHKIIKSINKVGYILSPITINERYEIIDGQGRLEALKTLGLPVDFVVAEGAGIDECIAMNIQQSNWKIEDFIHSYAEQGILEYQYLEQLVRKYKDRKIPLTIIYRVADYGAGSNQRVKNGTFACDSRKFDEANTELSYMEAVADNINRVGGRKTEYYLAMDFMLRNKRINNAELVNKINKNSHKIISVGDVKAALVVLQEIYNTRRQKKVFVESDFMEEKANQEV